MTRFKALAFVPASFAVAALVAHAGCRTTTATVGQPSGSEVAVSVVSGGLNNTTGSVVAMNELRAPRTSPALRVLRALNPIGTAYAADWSCKGGLLSPTYAGPGKDPYEYTPLGCAVTWAVGDTASSEWSGPFTLDYGSSCDDTHALPALQAAGCAITRTTRGTGDTRTITGPDGNSYAILHDTDGEGTGWDSTVSPAPSNGGLVLTCGSAGCAALETLVINGSHLTGTVTIDGESTKIWDHTVSTSATGLTVTGTGTNRVVTGKVTVEHNLLEYTSSTTFNDVGYGEGGCCFPTTGSVTTTFIKGADVGKTETLTFSGICGEVTLTPADGSEEPLTLEHCL
jgi:hypothetical protein